MHASEVKQLTQAPNKRRGIDMLYRQLMERQWQFNGRPASVAGYDYRKDLVHFTCTWSASGGGVGHRRVGLPMKDALTSNGDVSSAIILY